MGIAFSTVTIVARTLVGVTSYIAACLVLNGIK